MLTYIVRSIFSDCVLFYHAFQAKNTQICFDAYYPCISNCWVRPRGLQNIAYFNWGSTCRKVWEPLVYRFLQLFLDVYQCIHEQKIATQKQWLHCGKQQDFSRISSGYMAYSSHQNAHELRTSDREYAAAKTNCLSSSRRIMQSVAFWYPLPC